MTWQYILPTFRTDKYKGEKKHKPANQSFLPLHGGLISSTTVD